MLTKEIKHVHEVGLRVAILDHSVFVVYQGFIRCLYFVNLASFPYWSLKQLLLHIV